MALTGALPEPLPDDDFDALKTITPNWGPVKGGTTVVITGEGVTFERATKAWFGDNRHVATGFTRLPDGSIRCITPAHPPGRARVTVGDGSDEISKRRFFRYVPVPILTKVVPNVGPEPGKITVSLFGAGFKEGN